MEFQEAVSAEKTTRIMERMRNLGSFSIVKDEPHDPQILAKLKLTDMDDKDVLDGFHQLVEHGKLVETPFSHMLGYGGSTVPEPLYEDRIMYRHPV